MTSLLYRSAVAVLVLMLCPPAQAPTSSSELASRAGMARTNLADPNSEKKVDELLQRMTLDEKVGQLVQYSAGQPTGPGTGRTDYDDMIRKGEIGALFNITTAHRVNAYQRIAVEQSRLHIPILFGLDAIHGFRTEFPIPLGLASTWDPELVERAARVAARETSASGIRWTFSPMVDIARDARWGRMAEGRERIRISARQWRRRMCEVTREGGSMRRTASRRAPNTMWAMAQQKAVAITTPWNFPSTP